MRQTLRVSRNTRARVRRRRCEPELPGVGLVGLRPSPHGPFRQLHSAAGWHRRSVLAPSKFRQRWRAVTLMLTLCAAFTSADLREHHEAHGTEERHFERVPDTDQDDEVKPPGPPSPMRVVHQWATAR